MRLSSFFPPAREWFSRVPLLPVLLLALLFLPIESRSADAPKWDNSQPGQLALQQNGKDVWRFHYGKVTKPFFDPVCVAGGPSLTWARPPDHTWHLGLWFSWKTINGVNYWEERKGVADGKTRWNEPKIETRPDGSATLSLALEYLPAPRKAKGAKTAAPDVANPVPVLTETRTIRLSAPAADGSYFMDWAQVFTAGADIKLDRTPPVSKGGKASGGYAGLSIRYAKDFSEVASIISTKGRVSGHLRDDPAAEQNGLIGGVPYGIAVIAHPGNPRARGDWYLKEEGKMNFHYLNASLLSTAPLSFAKGETFTLRYRVHVHPGRWDAARLQAAADAANAGAVAVGL